MSSYSGKIKPAYSQKISGLKEPELSAKLKKTGTFILGSLFICGFIWLGGKAFSINWIKYAGIILGTLLVVIAVINGVKYRLSECPYCGAVVGNGDDIIHEKDELEKIECDNCYEWLMSDQGKIRAYTNEDAQKKIDEELEFDREYMPKYKAHTFKNGKWPDECIVCGKKPVKTEDAKDTNLKVLQLLAGRISVQWGSVKNIPYCAEHSGAVKADIVDDYMMLVFNDYEARRRYLAVNSGLKPEKIKSKKK